RIGRLGQVEVPEGLLVGVAGLVVEVPAGLPDGHGPLRRPVGAGGGLDAVALAQLAVLTATHGGHRPHGRDPGSRRQADEHRAAGAGGVAGPAAAGAPRAGGTRPGPAGPAATAVPAPPEQETGRP